MEYSLVGPAYVDMTLPVSAQDTVNWIPEQVETEGGRSQAILRTPPGLQAFATFPSGTCRGLNVMANVLYAVYGTKLYTVSESGIPTLLGTIAGTGPVGMANNGTQLVVVNGTQGYAYNNQTLLFGQITDPDFQPAASVAYLDGYFIFDGVGGQFFISALGNGTQYDALDFATAEASPDGTISVFVDHQELWVCGELTIEIWVNSGDPDFPFQRVTGQIMERGVGGPYVMQKLDNTVYWLGDNGIVYNAAGHTPVRISTFAIEQEIAKYQDLSEFNTWQEVNKGHWFYYLQCPNGGKTFAYDAATKQWHRRKSYNIDSWRVTQWTGAYGMRLCGDAYSGILWTLSDEVYTEGNDPMVSERYSAYLHAEQNPVFNHSVELVMNTGFGTNALPDPQVDIRWSDDWGNNYCSFKRRSLGAVGEYAKRIRVQQLGMFRNRLFHIRVSDAVRRDIVVAEVRSNTGWTT